MPMHMHVGGCLGAGLIIQSYSPKISATVTTTIASHTTTIIKSPIPNFW